jgi:hypothetical protein
VSILVRAGIPAGVMELYTLPLAYWLLKTFALPTVPTEL